MRFTETSVHTSIRKTVKRYELVENVFPSAPVHLCNVVIAIVS
jgi:hypothetical protein